MKRLSILGLVFFSMGSLAFANQPINYLPNYQDPLQQTMNNIQSFQQIQQNRIQIETQRLQNEQLKQEQYALSQLQDLSYPNQGKAVNNHNEFCERLQGLATSVMKARQLGHPASSIMQQANGLFQDEPFKSIVVYAYKRPMQSTNQLKLQSAIEYGNDAFVGCIQVPAPTTN